MLKDDFLPIIVLIKKMSFGFIELQIPIKKPERLRNSFQKKQSQMGDQAAEILLQQWFMLIKKPLIRFPKF